MKNCRELADIWKVIADEYHEERIHGKDRPDVTIRNSIDTFGRDAVGEALATVIRLKSTDGRISAGTRSWAAGIECNPTACTYGPDNTFMYAGLDEVHPAHLDQLVRALRDIK